MKVSHAPATAVTSTDETAGQAGGEVPGMLEVLALVPGMRKRRGRRFALVFILAVAVACVLAQAKSFREIGTMPLTCRRRSWPGSAGRRTRCCGASSPPARSGSAP